MLAVSRTPLREALKFLASEGLIELVAARDRLAYFKLNQQIHSAFLRPSGNTALESAHAAIQSRLKRIRYIGNQEPDKWADAMREHDEMIRALEARDGEALARVVNLHMENTWERVRRTL